jgi:hypothetical protein
MAGITTDIATGQIDKGDTKTFSVVVKDAGGTKLKLTSLDLEIDVAGNVSTYSIADFSETNRVYELQHEFQNAGVAEVDVTVTDQPNRDTERETESIYIANG